MGEAIDKLVSGDMISEINARKAFPILVDLAYRKETITYTELMNKIGAKHPRNSGPILGCIGYALDELGENWNDDIPPIQCLVHNKQSQLPGGGIGWFFNEEKFEQKSKEEKLEITNEALQEVYNFKLWDKVLEEFKLKPLKKHVSVGRGTKTDRQREYVQEEEIDEELQDISMEDIRKMLDKVNRTNEVLIEVKGQRWKRNDVLVGIIKRKRGYKCQICGTAIKKKNGKLYAEGAHIIAKRTGLGKETPDNIIILCPNHHKEFDYADVEIIKHTDTVFTFRMNGKEYKLSLRID